MPDAQKLAVAGDLGKLSLALRRTGAAEIATASMRRTRAAATLGARRGPPRPRRPAPGRQPARASAGRPGGTGRAGPCIVVQATPSRAVDGPRRAPASGV